MLRLLILADDLTGAADCAHAFTDAGVSATVIFNEEREEITSEILSIDCDTRHLPSEEAAVQVADVMHRYIGEYSCLKVFKKVDSTLRGNIGAELRALLQVCRDNSNGQRTVAIMAPAFPTHGRTTINGYQMVHGIPLDQTEMWIHHGLSGEAYLPAMLQREGLQAGLLSLELIRSDQQHLSARMQSLSSEADVLVCDAESDEDLKAIAEASISLGQGFIWVGSAGLAYPLARAIHLPRSAYSLDRIRPSIAPILFVIGSASHVSCRQAMRLERHTSVNAISISPSTLLHGPLTSAWSDVAANIGASLQSGHDTLLVLDAAERVERVERHRLTDALGLMLAPHAKTVGALVATGGETARAIFERWGVTSFAMAGEVERGLPYSLARLGGDLLPVLTKAGAFGNDETLVVCRSFLNSLLREHDYDSVRKNS